MGNADEELKRVADEVTEPVWESGLANYLRTL
jgi:hydroxymethylpyrimidine pyrophosphatase-like HAD family hydrolase